MDNRLAERLWARVTKSDTGCWLWTGYIGVDGRGRVATGHGNSPMLVHRASWEIHRGPIPKHTAITQSCGVLHCVRPDHLQMTPRGGPLAERFWRRVEKTSGCWLWRGAHKSADGHGHVNLGLGRFVMAHRAAWELVNGPIPDGLWVLHRCDTPLCVRAETGGAGHLFLGTHDDNMADMVSKGRSSGGARHWASRLTDADVIAMRAAAAAGVTHAALALRFGVVRQAISKIVARRSWAHLP